MANAKHSARTGQISHHALAAATAAWFALESSTKNTFVGTDRHAAWRIQGGDHSVSMPTSCRPYQRQATAVSRRAVSVVVDLRVGVAVAVLEQRQLPLTPTTPALCLLPSRFDHTRARSARRVPAALTPSMRGHEATSPIVRTSREVVRTGLFGSVHVDCRGLFTDYPPR